VVTGALGKLGPIWAGGLLDAGATVAGIDLESVPASAAFEGLREQYGEQRFVCTAPTSASAPSSTRHVPGSWTISASRMSW
jgi:hypothetical protein